MNALEFFRRGLNTLEIANITGWDEWDVVKEIDRLRDLEHAAAYQRKVSRDAALTALETLKKHGMQVTELSPADLDKMREMVKPVVEKYTQEVGEDTIKSMYAEIDKIRKP